MSVFILFCHSYLNSWHQPVLRPGSEVRENLREYLEVVENLWSSSEAVGKIFGNHRKVSELLRKFALCEDENLTHWT